jgi:hypothetical protein
MLSYKQWKNLNESLGGAIPLGVSTPQNLGAVGSNLNLRQLEIELDEAKKKMIMKAKKKMAGSCPSDDDDDDDDNGDDSEMDMKMDIKGKGDDSDMDMDDDNGDDDESGGDDAIMMKKCMKKKSKKCMKKNMKKEHTVKEYNPNETEDEFFASLQSQLSGGLPSDKNWDGLSVQQEDALYNAQDPNTGLADMNPQVSDNPQPGEAGYAPDTRVATQFGENANQIDGFFQNLVEELLADREVSEEIKHKILGKLD